MEVEPKVAAEAVEVTSFPAHSRFPSQEFCQAGPEISVESLWCSGPHPPLSFRDLITRRLTNGPSEELQIAYKKDQQLKARLPPVTPSLILTGDTLHTV